MELTIEEASELRADLERQRIITLNAYADGCAAVPHDRHDHSIQSGSHALLVNALANLASPNPATRAADGAMAEKIRSKLNLSWNQLLVRESDEDDLDDDDDEFDLDDDEDF